MELFDPKFVHFMWDDELEGKKCFLADEIATLRSYVERGGEYDSRSVIFSRNESMPFRAADGIYAHRFAYYDPNFSIKKAWEAGKKIQFCHRGDHDHWYDDSNPSWEPDCEYRVKPEEKRYRPYVSSAEMIADFKNRFKVKCPPYAEPLIWVGLKQQDCWFLITGIFSGSVKINGTLCMLENLFNCYTYRDGGPVGMEVKE